MKKAMIAALLGATLLASGAHAATLQDGPPRDPLARADANGDGIVTREESLAEATEHFNKLDTNKDGKLSPSEREAMRGPGGGPGGPGGPGGGRMMERLDSNDDGMISLEEMRAQAGQRFDRLDTNHDGKLDKAERDAAMQRMRRFMGRGDTPPPPPPPPAAN